MTPQCQALTDTVSQETPGHILPQNQKKNEKNGLVKCSYIEFSLLIKKINVIRNVATNSCKCFIFHVTFYFLWFWGEIWPLTFFLRLPMNYWHSMIVSVIFILGAANAWERWIWMISYLDREFGSVISKTRIPDQSGHKHTRVPFSLLHTFQ